MTPLYPKEIDANIKYRVRLLQECHKNPKVQAEVIAECKDDILFYVNSFGYTYNPKIEPFDHEFITYPYQDDYLNSMVGFIENGLDNITEKSREMGVSWLYVVLQSYGFLFRQWSSLYGSYKESYVDKQGDMDSNFERLRYFLSYHPQWMLPDDLIDKYMSIGSKKLGTEIAGDSGPNFGTGGRRKIVFLDEFQLWPFAEKAFRKTRDVASCRIFNGTPEGKYNVYGKINTGHKDYRHLDIKKLRLHWKLHPLKTDEWYENEKNNRTKEDMARELDISYDASVKGAVYPHFKTLVDFGKFEYNPKLPLYTSWDFGRDMVSIIWVQHDVKNGRFIVIDSFQLSSYDRDGGVDIDFFAAFVTGEPTQGYVYEEDELELIEKHKPWRSKYSGHKGDPYNAHSKTTNAKSSIAEILAKFGIHLSTKRGTTVADRIIKATLFLKKLCVNIDLDDFIGAIEQSRYPETAETSQTTKEKIEPVHDANSHYRTAYEYFVDDEPVIIDSEDIERRERENAHLRKQIKTGNRLGAY